MVSTYWEASIRRLGFEKEAQGKDTPHAGTRSQVSGMPARHNNGMVMHHNNGTVGVRKRSTVKGHATRRDVVSGMLTRHNNRKGISYYSLL